MQEALSNAARHGGGRRVDVSLATEASGAVLTVVDDGSGFPEDAARRLRSRGGLAGIRERVASLGGGLDFGNVNGGGARVTIRVPLRATPRAKSEV
jgi:signal transduction histidine kinase